MISATERRTGWLLAALLLGQLILLAVQAPSAGAGDNFLEGVVLRVVAPLAAAVRGVSDGVARLGESFRRQGDVVAENRELHAKVEQLELRLQRLDGVDGELKRLAAALGYELPPGGSLRVADVVYVDYSSWLRTLLVYVGDGAVERNQPVVDDAGLVGRVVLVASPYAKVQLITDRAAAVGAMIQRTRRQGVVRSGGAGLELDFLSLQADVRVGDRVVTSGTDGVYPRGIPVGTVVSVAAGDELFHVIRLVPAVDFGVLDQVYVLSRPPLPDALPESPPGAID
jgi:rod shape-determining protein MreC